MDTIDQNVAGSLHISSSISTFLTTTYKWTKFLSILGFVMLGLMGLGGLGLIVSGASIPGSAAPAALMGVIYIAMCAIYFFPTLYLYNFSVKMKTALTASSQDELEASFENLKSLFKFIGILTIVMIALYILIIIFGIIAAGVALSMMR